MRKCLIIIGIFLKTIDCCGQTFNINGSNGLISNHTFCAATDNHGYLWIGAKDGVYRYNGYHLEHYGISDGLPAKQVWWLETDEKGRIWPYSISDKLAYIRDNRIVGTVNSGGEILYPSQGTIHNDRYAFISGYNISKGSSLCIVRSDTIYSTPLPVRDRIAVINRGDVVLVGNGDSLFKLGFTVSGKNTVSFYRKSVFTPEGIDDVVSSTISFSYSKYLVCYDIGKSALQAYNLDNGTYLRKNPGGRIHLCSYDREAMYVVTDNLVHSFDKKLNFLQSMSLSGLSGNAHLTGGSVTNFIKSRFWGTCLTTSTSGVYLQFPRLATREKFMRAALPAGLFIGYSPDNARYWWNERTQELILSDAKRLENFHLPGIQNIKRIVTYNRDSALLLSPSGIHWFNKITGKSMPVLSAVDQENLEIRSPFSGLDAFVAMDTIFVASATQGLYLLHPGNAGYESISLSDERYIGLAYDFGRNLLLAYGNNKIDVFKHAQKLFTISDGLLKASGIRYIERILTDSTGNVFIQTESKLLYVNSRLLIGDLSAGVNLEDAAVGLAGRYLAIVGRFGVSIRKILGQDNFKSIDVSRNPKDIFYRLVNEVTIGERRVNFKTDRGIFGIPLTTGQSGNDVSAVENSYRLVAAVSGKMRNINRGDTIFLSQTSPFVSVDVIKPDGIGPVKILYKVEKIGGQFVSTNGGNIWFSSNEPDRYYKVSLLIRDAVWNSAPFDVFVYTVPNWWQRTTVRPILWTAFAIVLLSLLGLAVILTKRVVMRVNHKNNQLRELELRAIHAQINPHFIFNTLSVTQYFIGKNENERAGDHLLKFSRLLRNYLKSARSQIVSVAEEVQNLSDYVTLQRIRFREKFDFVIVVDEKIDAANTKIPALLLQPIVENAINHGLFHKKENGFLSINFKRGINENELICVIDDNGIGRAVSQNLNEHTRSGPSYGNKLLQDLVDIFRKFRQMEIHISYMDKRPPATGTTVTVTVKNQMPR